MRKTRRLVKLKVMDGKNVLTSSGMVDNRLFTNPDDNPLVVERNTQTGLWSIKFEKGILPKPLLGSFTRFLDAIKAIEMYYGKRNVEIKEIID